jgi:hypothetical protein
MSGAGQADNNIRGARCELCAKGGELVLDTALCEYLGWHTGLWALSAGWSGRSREGRLGGADRAKF